MPANGQRLGKEICQVEDAGDEHDAKLALIHAISEPVEAHIQGLGEMWRHGAVGEPDRALIVAIYHSGRLGVPEVCQDLSLVEGDAGSGEDTGDFGLGHKGDDHMDACGMRGDELVDGGFGVRGEEIRRAAHAHVVDGAGDRTCAGTGKVGGIRMHPQDHIGSPIDLAGIGMREDIAKKTIETRHGGKGRGCLFAGDGAGGGKDAAVHAAPVV